MSNTPPRHTRSKDYLVDNEGRFRFTQDGLARQAPLLRKAGIDARSIKTYDAYLQARKAAQPYFGEYLCEYADNMLQSRPDCLEIQLLHAIIYSDEALIKKLKNKLERKQALKGV